MKEKSSYAAKVLWVGKLALAVAFVTLGLIVGLVDSARAEGRAHRIVIYIEGPEAESAKRDASQGMPQGVAIVDDGRTNEASARAGIRGHVGAMLANAKQRKLLAPKLRQMAAAAGADAAMVGFAGKGKGERDIPVMLVSGKNQVSFDKIAVASGDNVNDRASKWAAFVNVAMPDSGAGSQPAAASEPAAPAAAAAETPPDRSAARASEDVSTSEPAREPGADAGPKDRHASRESNDPATASAIIGVGYEAGFRSFSFNDAISSNLRPYHVSGVPGAALSAEVFPLATSDVGALKNIGLVGRYMRAFGLASSTSDGQKVDTTWQEYEFGLRGRLRAGSGRSAPLLGAQVSYSRIQFDFAEPASAGPLDAQLPGADYKLLRTQIDARIPISEISLIVGASYLAVLDVSPLGDRFSRESVHGLGAELGGATNLAPWLEARLMARYDRIFYKMNPEVGDGYVAGGALDQYFAINAGLAAIF